jgi:antitoxin component YwqK of YwqJK toxin-antitoxin module
VNKTRSSFPESGAARHCFYCWSGIVGQEDLIKERIDRHEDGTIKAKGHTVDDVLTGYWEWFRKDGTKMRSGHFDNGKQAGEWTTYDAQGKVVKVTKMKS